MVAKLNKKVELYKEEIYTKPDKNGMAEERVTQFHPLLDKYVVRASILMDAGGQANRCCAWLNAMVMEREGISDRFKVIHYKGSHKTWVVARKLLPDDLVSGLDEMIEVKSR
jgi:hypothetical protein